MTALARLPGVTFEAPAPPREDVLPRMDIAAFVGFASSGPIGVPVVVESPRRFRDVFGPDPELAWDDERGEVRRAHLGGAVEAFFSNGGVRCWVVRTADTATVARHTFELPGLIRAADRALWPAPLVRARARAHGSWCEPLAVSTALTRDPLPLQRTMAGDPIALSPGAYRIDLAVDRARLTPGDLLEITFDRSGPILLLFVERVVSVPGGVRVESAGVESGETRGAFWVQPPLAGSPAADALSLETTPPVPISESAGLAAASLLLGSPPSRVIVSRLSFEIQVWKGTELQQQLTALAFSERHPRCWAKLPDDDELFTRSIGTITDPLEGLILEASAPRFALAGPAGGAAAHYLPWGMGRVRKSDVARGVDIAATAGTSALERDGLARFGAGLFLDERLAAVGAGSLLGELEYRYYVAGSRLSGIHSLLPIEEASLVAVPDAVHRGWSRELPTPPTPLGAPLLDPVPDADTASRYHLTWSSVAGAASYTLQFDFDPDFPAAVTAFADLALTAPVTLPPQCPAEVFFRVRATSDTEIGPWSNTRGARLPAEAFAPCVAARPGSLWLDFTGDSASPSPALVWTTVDPVEALPLEWEIEEATEPQFSAAVPFAGDTMVAGYAPLPERRFTARYYRIRARAAGVAGPWSNTVFVGATERAAFTETASRVYDSTALLAVHRALLRFAAARGDLLALLSLPSHYRAPEALEHSGRLTPGGPEEEPAALASSPLTPRVPPLTEGETRVLSFGTLHHPWIVSRASGTLRRMAPDGAVAGVLAASALEDGAWRAAANRPFTGVVALEHDLRSWWARLVPARVNVILNTARGFLAQSEDTLGGESALERVHVRRLLILLRRVALREGQRAVFEPHGPELQRRLHHEFRQLLGELFHRGAFEGVDAEEAFRVVVDETNNRPASIEQGKLFVELQVAPAAALTFVTVRLITAGPGRLVVEEG